MPTHVPYSTKTGHDEKGREKKNNHGHAASGRNALLPSSSFAGRGHSSAVYFCCARLKMKVPPLPLARPTSRSCVVGSQNQRKSKASLQHIENLTFWSRIERFVVLVLAIRRTKAKKPSGKTYVKRTYVCKLSVGHSGMPSGVFASCDWLGQ